MLIVCRFFQCMQQLHHRFIIIQFVMQQYRHNTLYLFGSAERYDNWLRMNALSSRLYKHDWNFYSDSREERHRRNVEEISKLRECIRNGDVAPGMLEFNVSNCFYPSYVLAHHFFSFVKMMEVFEATHPQLGSIMADIKSAEKLGAIFYFTLNTEFKTSEQPELRNERIFMREHDYFYSPSTSPYLTYCCLAIKQGQQKWLAVVRLRDESGQWAAGIEAKDIGGNISPDYLNVAYRLNDVKPLFLVPIFKPRIVRQIRNKEQMMNFSLSLMDLSRSIHIAIKYACMRKQFKTRDDKTERPIIEYQAISARIIDAFGLLFALSHLHHRLLVLPFVESMYSPYLAPLHDLILDSVLQLREGCGAFGYLQVSGFGAPIQRISYRAGQPHLVQIPEIPQLMKRIHYFSSTDEIWNILVKNNRIKKSGEHEDCFNIFIGVCLNIKKNKDKINPKKYVQHVLIQSCLQIIQAIWNYIPIDKNNPTEHLHFYMIVKYLLENSQYISWEIFAEGQREEFYKKLTFKKTELLQLIGNEIPALQNMLEIGYLRNVILGRENSDEFYDELFHYCQSNKRNSQQYRRVVQEPIRNLIQKQRAML